MPKLTGFLERITYSNEENFYTIAKFSVEKSSITIVGYLAGVNLGENLIVEGNWVSHQKYGRQFQVSSFEILLPKTSDEILRYLSAGIIKGIGPKMAERLVLKFADKTIEVIEKTPEKLLQVSGIGKSTLQKILKSWQEYHNIRLIMQFLQEYGLQGSLASLILKNYGLDAIKKIQANPYCITLDLEEIPFSAAENFAFKMNIKEDDPRRIEAYILYLLTKEGKNGNVFAFREKILSDALKYLKVEEEKIIKEEANMLSKNLISKDLKDEEECLFLRDLYIAEIFCAKKIKIILSLKPKHLKLDQKEIDEKILSSLAIKLSNEQALVLNEIFSHKVSVITGGPGTGKTTLVRSVCAILNHFEEKFLLAAPTGRAARRLSELTKCPAQTIHRLLEYNFKGNYFARNEDNPLDAYVIIIDEASMVDIVLFYHLLLAIPSTSILILVGDSFQLPSISPGNVLADIIHSKVIKVFELTKIFRQAEESQIILNAHKIRNGEMPNLDNKNNSLDFYFVEQNDPKKVVEIIEELCSGRIAKAFKDIDEIQVLTPMHKGEVGTMNLNKVLQNIMNQNPNLIEKRGRLLKVGDKVMHLQNDYEKEVFNGEIGEVLSIDKEEATILINYDGKKIEYGFEEIDEIALAYAMTVHKSQGSEYSAVIIPLMEQHYPLLQCNLLYTAITRGKKLVILIGTKRALHIAISNKKGTERNTMLLKRLKE